MTIIQTANALGLKVRTIREWIKKEKIPADKNASGRWEISDEIIYDKEVQEFAYKGREHSKRIKESIQNNNGNDKKGF